ncbi:MAG: hypothetical protein IT282_05915 [Bacteroidetes bacterium]|nr:hypothetical protein [Bacteroidota bacterium]
MTAEYDPWRECFVARIWNGAEEEVTHLEIEAGPHRQPLLDPLTIFGSEARNP